MKSNCNKNKTQNLALKDSLHITMFTFDLSFSGDFFSLSLNGLNYLIIFNSGSQSAERDK